MKKIVSKKLPGFTLLEIKDTRFIYATKVQ